MSDMCGLIFNFITITVLLGLLSWIYFYFYGKESKTTLYYRKTRLSLLIVKKCKELSTNYWPAFWATNPHVQTLFSYFSSIPDLQYTRDYIQMFDYGVISLDWMKVEGISKANPVLFIIPGLISGSGSIASLCIHAAEKKFRPVVFNKRGYEKTPLTTYKLQSYGDTSDLHEALIYIQHNFPCAKIVAVSYSTGACLLLSYLGEVGKSSPFTSAVCISPGYDTDDLFQRGISQPYDWLITQSFKCLLHQHSALSSVIDFDFAMNSSCLKEFDERVFIKLSSHASFDEYMEVTNPMRNVSNISTPVLCISALDDPIFPKEHIPFSLFKTLSNFMLLATEKGGHCGFLEGFFAKSFTERVACTYLRTVLESGVRKSCVLSESSGMEEIVRNRSYTT